MNNEVRAVLEKDASRIFQAWKSYSYDELGTMFAKVLNKKLKETGKLMKMSDLYIDYPNKLEHVLVAGPPYKTMYNFVDCPQPSTQAAVNPSSLTERVKKIQEDKKKKGSDMYDLDCCEEDTMDMTKLNHLASRVSNTFYNKDTELQKKFGLVNDAPPNTPKELIDRITSGKYVVPEDRMNSPTYGDIRYFTWRDPSVKADQEGYEIAKKSLVKSRTAADDVIVVMSDDATRLKALQDFESATIQ